MSASPEANQSATGEPFDPRGLFKLSPELRNQIYELCLTHDRPLNIACVMKDTATATLRYNAEYPRDTKSPARLYPREPGLLQTCRRIRWEALAMFYGSNTFRSPNVPTLKVWLYHLGSERRGLLTNVRCEDCYGGWFDHVGTWADFEAGVSPATLWSGLHDWGFRNGSTSYRTSEETLLEIERVDVELERAGLEVPYGTVRVYGSVEILQDSDAPWVERLTRKRRMEMLWMNGHATADGMASRQWEAYKRTRVVCAVLKKLDKASTDGDIAASLAIDRICREGIYPEGTASYRGIKLTRTSNS